MCGIVGYIGDDSAQHIVDGLRRVEYRGYDSAGICVLVNGAPVTRKDVGKLEKVITAEHLESMDGEIGIGHVRWAAYGKVSQANSHPHEDCSGDIVLVHNGMIENVESFQMKGHKVKSETDSEIIVHQLEGEGDLASRVKDVGNKIKGQNAFVVLDVKQKRLIAYSNGLPLCYGKCNGGWIIASDASVVAEYTRSVYMMRSRSVIVISKDGPTVLDGDVDVIDFRWDYQFPKVQLGDYTMTEIFEQPASIISAALPQPETERFAMKLLKSRHVILTACGSSYHACLIGARLLSSIAGLTTHVVLASEIRSVAHLLGKKTAVIAVSQSGETADILDAVGFARSRGSEIHSILNVPWSTLGRMCSEMYTIRCGREIGVAATKSFTSQVVAFGCIAHAAVGDLYDFRDYVEVCSGILEDWLPTLHKEIESIVDMLWDEEHLYIIGRGSAYYAALEASLKMKEVACLHTEALMGAELKHGTLALIFDKTPVCILSCEYELQGDTELSALEVDARGAYVIGVSPTKFKGARMFIEIPGYGPLSTVFSVVPFQLIAHDLAIKRELDPDKPRNLAKSVTVK